MPDRAALSTRAVLETALESRVFPAAVAEVGDSRGTLWSDALGRLTFEPDAAPCAPDTIFDLASLTKPIATTSLVMQMAGNGRLSLDAPAAALFAEWRGADREPVVIRDFLEHSSGLSARLIDPPPTTRVEFEHDICTMRLEYEPRTRSVYSDLGFILLGLLVERLGATSLERQFADVAASLAPDPGEWLAYGVEPEARARTAPTVPLDQDHRRGRVLVGEVHDDYAAALGGEAGHSGVFGSAAAVGRFARAVLRGALGDRSGGPLFSAPVVARMTTRSRVPGSSRGLGWDTMLPTSSCGPDLSPAAFGHVGFTGTSLWIDPVLDRYFVLLTNRAFGDGTLDQMRDVRRAFHTAASKI